MHQLWCVASAVEQSNPRAGLGCSYQRPTRGAVCSTMRSMCGAGAGCLAVNYQSLCRPSRGLFEKAARLRDARRDPPGLPETLPSISRARRREEARPPGAASDLRFWYRDSGAGFGSGIWDSGLCSVSCVLCGVSCVLCVVVCCMFNAEIFHCY